MCADFGDVSLFQNQQSIGMTEGREPVGDGEGRSSTNQTFQGSLDLYFRLRVDIRCGLIQDENPRIA